MAGAAFVGRGRELDTLAAWLAAADPGVLLVTGPAGVGKTTLVERALAGAGRAEVVRGYCPAEVAPPLWPWRAALRRAGVAGAGGAVVTDESDREIAEVGAVGVGRPGAAGSRAVAGSGAGAAGEVEIEPAAAASARFAALAAMGDALAAAGPLLVVLEDLHWADAASLDLLQQVAAGAAGPSVAVLGTVRSPAPEDVAVRLAALGRYGAATLTLPPFTAAEVAMVVGAETAGDVLRRTGGLPLLVAAVRDGYDSADLATVVRTLLAALSPAQRAVIEAAAVLGDEVDEALLAAVVTAAGEAEPADPAGVAEAVTVAWHGGLLAADPGGHRFRFVHALVREGIADRLAPPAARRLHRAAALALESSADADRAGRIAAHWRRAGPGADARTAASRWSRRAAARARSAHAYDDTVGHLTDALADLATVDTEPAERIEATIELAHAEYLAGRYDRCLAHCADAAEAGGAAGRGDLVARAALVLQGVTYPRAAHVVSRLCRQALAHPDLPDGLRARLLAQVAVMEADSSRVAAAEAPARESLALAEASGDPHAEVEAARAREMTLVHPGDQEERLRLGDLVADRAEPLGLPLTALIGHEWRMQAGYATGRLDVVDSAAAAIERIATRSGLPLARWHWYRMLAARNVLSGAYAESVGYSRRATEIVRGSGDLTANAMHFAHGIRVACTRGDAAAVPPGALAAFGTGPDMPLVIVQRCNTMALLGREREAREDYDRLVTMLPIPPEHPAWMAVLVELTDAIVRYGDAATAEVAYRQLLPFRRYPGALGTATVYFIGTISRQLGELAAVFGDRETAEELLREALARNRQLGARPDVAATSLDLARLLASGGGRDGDGSPTEAAALARDALTVATRLDMPGLVTAAGELSGRIAAELAGADPLTGREREVAALLGDAMTNRQIAGRLVLSERTVESHVRSILAKTGCANRTEFVAKWREIRR